MQEGISVREAAGILGTTERAVRFRLQRKTLSGTRVDGKWWVYLNGTELPRTGNGMVAVQDREAVPEWFSAVVQKSLDQAEEIGRLKERITYLEAMVQEDSISHEPRGFWSWLRGKER